MAHAAIPVTPVTSLVIEQGHALTRPSTLFVEVHVAEREGLKTILTVDHNDFETYRIGRNAKFRILPARTR